MFHAWCPACGADVLLTTRRIRRVEQLDGGGIDVHFMCWCGTDGVWETGRDRSSDDRAVQVAPGA